MSDYNKISDEELLRRIRAGLQSTVQPETYDPTGSFGENVAAGLGGAMADIGRRAQQLGSYVGIGDKKAIQQEIDDADKRDAALKRTAGGFIGNVGGQIGAALLPGGALMRAGKLMEAIPGVAGAGSSIAAAGRASMIPQTIPGAAAVGAAQGLAQPVTSEGSTAANVGMGALGGAALPTGIAAAGLGRDLVSPFFRSGQERLAGRTLERFASDPEAILRANAQELVPGSRPTLAEATGDVGLAQLQRTLRNNPDANNAITERLAQNQEARLNALRGIAGDDAQREFYVGMRDQAAKQLYDRAFSEMPSTTPWVKGQLTQLSKRPAFMEALGNAQKLAAEEGLTLEPKNVTQVLHYTKMALDDLIVGAKGNEQRAIAGTKAKLIGLMESKDFSPSYREARDTFAKMSRPINQMDVGTELYNKLQPALADFGATSRVRPQAYAQAVRDADATAQRATGFRGAKMENILTPEQMSVVQNIANDLGRSANAQGLGMSAGSPTAQNLVSQDILRGTLGPLGLPGGWAESTAMQQLMRPMTWAYQPSEKRVLGLLGDASLDPKEAKRLIEQLRKRGLLSDLTESYAPLSAPLGAAGLLNFRQ